MNWMEHYEQNDEQIYPGRVSTCTLGCFERRGVAWPMLIGGLVVSAQTYEFKMLAEWADE